jgi:predicted alpha/beta-fold hydrolase
VVIDWVKNQGANQIYLVGFSLGGNLVLKYLGERSAAAQASITAAAAISVPVDLAGSSVQLDSWRCWPYRQRFLQTLKAKILQKAPAFPGHYALDKLAQTRLLRAFDEYFTAPIHGFNGAADYYEKASSLQFLDNIQRPTLLLQAANDPFLSAGCYPRELARQHADLLLEISREGGHVGFLQAGKPYTWPEQRVVDFFAKCE